MATKTKKTIEPEKNVATSKLDILISIINKKKGDFYTDLMPSLGVNFTFKVLGEGTASEQMKSLLGLSTSEKLVMFNVISRDKVPNAMATLEEKFRTIKDGKGIAFTISLSSVIGKSIYGFLSDNRTIKEDA